MSTAAIEILEREIALRKEGAKQWHGAGNGELYRFSVMCADVLTSVLNRCKALEQESPPRLLTVERACWITGIAVPTMRLKIYRREIEYVKIGRSVRISEREIARLISESTVPRAEKGAER